MKKVLLVGMIIFLFIPLISGCALETSKGSAENLAIVTVTKRDIKSTANLSGIVKADPRVLIISKVIGNITKIYVKTGDLLKKDDKICDIEVENINAGYTRKFKYTVVSPIDGTLLKLNCEVGDTVLLGSVIGVVGNTKQFIVDAFADEIDAVNIKKGQEAMISFDAFPYKTLKGKVIYVADTTTTTKQGVQAYEVKISLPDSDLNIKDGLSATVDITTNEKHNVLTVPIESVARDNGKSYVVLILPDGKREKRFVQVGVSSDNYTEILSGLKEGDKILEIPDEDIFKDIETKDVNKNNGNGG